VVAFVIIIGFIYLLFRPIKEEKRCLEQSLLV
jgi:hypothetical protein